MIVTTGYGWKQFDNNINNNKNNNDYCSNGHWRAPAMRVRIKQGVCVLKHNLDVSANSTSPDIITHKTCRTMSLQGHTKPDTNCASKASNPSVLKKSCQKYTVGHDVCEGVVHCL